MQCILLMYILSLLFVELRCKMISSNLRAKIIGALETCYTSVGRGGKSKEHTALFSFAIREAMGRSYALDCACTHKASCAQLAFYVQFFGNRRVH